MTVVDFLEEASCLLRSVEQDARIHADAALGDRLEALERRVETETIYVRNCALGLPRVQRPDRPGRPTIGQLLQNPATRALREARGVSNPPLRVPARSAA